MPQRRDLSLRRQSALLVAVILTLALWHWKTFQQWPLTCTKFYRRPVHTTRFHGRLEMTPVFAIDVFDTSEQVRCSPLKFITPVNSGPEHGRLSTLPVFTARVHGCHLDTREHGCNFGIFTALHVMQTRYSDKNSVCLSVRPSHA